MYTITQYIMCCLVIAMEFVLLNYLLRLIFFMNKAFALKTCFGPPLNNNRQGTSSASCDKSDEYLHAPMIVHSVLLPPLINKEQILDTFLVSTNYPLLLQICL